ncbi:hypothetical protein MNR02_06680 [Shinella sp. H4-D48]|uniref:GrlR family regulatory protein n=1 Tax=Shinella sp. H4-D48 TaxID=2925841 RepID=UPI001F531753|nr:GrlR family regulatory protein [Shinella sp. H4-D48]UNK39387.1 hypothetical protein MNR02_06680 [Shinella sp. H4-D48]
MRDGLYAVQFATPLGAGGGVVYLEAGRLRGGDSAIFYTGDYSVNGDQFSATVSTGRHTQGMASVFGIDSVIINVKGQVVGDTVNATGTSPQAPNLQFRATIKRLSD